jgi:RNA polymerase II subunit A small phosphatase-like protein
VERKFKNNEKLLLILDIDETLIHATKKELNQKVDFKVFDYNVYKRPFLDDFLNEVKDDFLLAIWSSASDDYVEEITKQIIPEEIKLEFVWGRSRCTYRRNIQRDEYGYYNDDFNNHYHYIKPLKKVRRKGYRLNRILIVDDSPHKSKDNFGNAIYPKEFIGDIKDAELKLLAQYLKMLKNKENVRRIEKRNWQNSIK